MTATATPITPRRREDLQVFPRRLRSKRIWIIKDPITLSYFQFRREEFAIFSWLDGATSLRSIKERFEQTFAPRRITVSRIQSFVSTLHGNGLVLTDVLGQGDRLVERNRRGKRSRWISAWMNPLAIRLPGFDPSKLLRWLHPRMQWVFSPFCLLICA
ncbi:MAG: hemolysin D, partial [Planctomycetota bacterium]